MVLDPEAVRPGGPAERPFDGRLGFGVQDNVGDATARTTDQMVMVPAEVLGQFEVGMVRSHREAADHLRLLQDGQCPVDRTLGQPGGERQNLGNRQWSAGPGERIDHLAMVGREAPPAASQAQADLVVESVPISHG